VYKSPPIVGEPTKENESTITQDYEDNARKIAQQRIALAGVRLANLLNEAFK
jgi:S1/P1 Nuclease